MSQMIEVKVPDIGDYTDVPVIDVCVKAGDVVKVDDALVTLESDKATMDVPSSAAGVVKEVRVKLGDKISEGAVVVVLEAAGASAAAAPAAVSSNAPAAAPAVAPAAQAPAAGGASVEVSVPDIGDYSDVPVIDICVKVGDTVKVDDALVTLESDKATMDVPSSAAGVVKEIKVKLGDKVSAGAVVVVLDSAGGAPTAAVAAVPASPVAAAPAAAAPAASAAPAAVAAPPAAGLAIGSRTHASPSVRLLARELGVDLSRVTPSGPKSRILKEDVSAYVKSVLSAGPAAAAAAGASLGGGLDLLPWPKVDFAKFGAVEVKPLSRIKKISAQNLARNWVMIPAVTYHEDADITDLEAFRVAMNKENEKSGTKITMLAFLIKASVMALKKFPEFNSSLDVQNGEMSLVMKQYFNIAFAADTPNGLVVPVVKNADQKSVTQIVVESGELARKARDGKLGPADMSGACFTISSLGGIGGTYFSPIVNAPEVAILGVNKSVMKPVWNGREFEPRLILPMSLTADHRVIDGALATRFNVYLAQLLADMRRVLL
ncbi:MAG: dihydrolipoyllysine-residue acetyltransferase [Candidatus Accumulibacter sp.]|jgi:pyruvate dehydrogenase E2 component (dihydrolipoamide acetyltransferase)|uniref:dihydrolipoyllysine-residue acetyltransferase n=2 Tax=Accumulibacter sp. TaxID=2053492 RepID=UPI0012BE1D1E|nr:dihydrolipoyllysine-residue acetyltransferase [Accumulibacter sp.]MBL8369618.1 dihydrolipoyllysine-residue acetyltransferase [Accumulibacter sp.]MBN8513422.1 dihydrolipoyllysine-residue acetyltransferase [Accumulibacter sp.]MQM34135.1 dihydrolipoyllysine-residue acetyltransferase [Candidatus Accumulibacter phosphatis]